MTDDTNVGNHIDNTPAAQEAFQAMLLSHAETMEQRFVTNERFDQMIATLAPQQQVDGVIASLARLEVVVNAMPSRIDQTANRNLDAMRTLHNEHRNEISQQIMPLLSIPGAMERIVSLVDDLVPRLRGQDQRIDDTNKQVDEIVTRVGALEVETNQARNERQKQKEEYDTLLFGDKKKNQDGIIAILEEMKKQQADKLQELMDMFGPVVSWAQARQRIESSVIGVFKKSGKGLWSMLTNPAFLRVVAGALGLSGGAAITDHFIW